MRAINTALEWITRLAYLNILWILFSLGGLIVVGLFPATAATFAVARKWVMGQTDVAVFKTFWASYKKEFMKSNILGYLSTLVGYILYLDFVYLTVSPSNMTAILTIPFLIIGFIYVLTLFYVFPTFVHYDLKVLQVIKSSFFVMIINPLPTLTMLGGTLGIGFILWKFQGLAIFFSMSVLAVVIMMPAYHAFEKIYKKKQVYLHEKALRG
ncbi:YesL family protein [Lederbergia sp. NSJ-179]|uniref:YesL family protein n=1 Tax=Lederbergia sp. NSJ-179 TaxID=2931402 RepID=UPI001FD4F768|nr:YesL family protein [Lederbergia sp. NSJ-179]MCJ7843307.1 YesL family protein [Lederbergia sp. NSJ-179]